MIRRRRGAKIPRKLEKAFAAYLEHGEQATSAVAVIARYAALTGDRRAADLVLSD